MHYNNPNMKTVLDLLIASNANKESLLAFIKEHKDDCKFTFDSPIADILSKAIRTDNLIIFDQIMLHTFDINALTSGNSTPILIASLYGKVEFLTKLLQKNADISYHPRLNKSALSNCFCSDMGQNNFKCAELLIIAGAGIEELKTKHNMEYQMSCYIKQKLDEIPKQVELKHDQKVIRIVSDNRCIKSELKLLRSQFLTILCHDAKDIAQMGTYTNTYIELPISGEKILKHILPEGIIVNGKPLTVPLIVRIFSNITLDDNTTVDLATIYS